jgi:hypothetical protein
MAGSHLRENHFSCERLSDLTSACHIARVKKSVNIGGSLTRSAMEFSLHVAYTDCENAAGWAKEH